MSNKTIPKKIHQIWIGDSSKMPKRFMDTWKMKDSVEVWEHNLWTEKEIDALELKNRKLYDFYLKQKNYHGASDVARAEILERFGGIYIDADTERLLPIDDAPFMKSEFFAVQANKNVGVPQGQTRVANGIIGAVAGHPILTEYVERIGKAKELTPPWCTIGGTLFSQVIANFFASGNESIDKAMILQPHTFYPFDSRGKKADTTGITYAQHVWGTTHKLYGKI